VSNSLVKPSYIAEKVGMTVATVDRWLRIGYLPYIKTPGGHYMITKETADKFVENMKAGGTPTDWIGGTG